MTGPPSFAAAMALRPAPDAEPDPLVGGPVFTGRLDAHWTVGPKLHGGTLLALVTAAARRAWVGERHDGGASDGMTPVAVSASFLAAPAPGELTLHTAVRKRGRRIGTVEVSLRAPGEADRRRTCVRAEVTMGAPEAPGAPLLSASSAAAAMPPAPPADVAAIAPGHPAHGILNLATVCDVHPDLRSWRRPADGTSPAMRTWVRPRDADPDLLFAVLCTDISAPITATVGRHGWAPTVQLTAYLRGVPAPGWLRVACTTTEIGRGWFDADHTVVDADGALVAQSRQLALVPPD